MLVISLLFSFTALGAHAQAVQPTCNGCPAAYVPKEEVDAYTRRAIAENLIDQQIRQWWMSATPMSGSAVVYRGKLASPAPDSVAEHDKVSEVYHVLDGSATLVTSPRHRRREAASRRCRNSAPAQRPGK